MFVSYQFLEILISSALIVSSVYSGVLSSYCVHLVEKTCKYSSVTAQIMAVYPQAVAVACTLNRTKTILCTVKNRFEEYTAKIAGYERCFPADGLRETNANRAFAWTVASAYVALIFPICALRMYSIYGEIHEKSAVVVMFLVSTDAQNASVCWTEVNFMRNCFWLYRKFRHINDDMSAFKRETIVRNKYPSVLHRSGAERLGPVNPGVHVPAASDRRGNRLDFTPGRPDKVLTTAGSVELNRIKHQFFRDVFADLNDLYGFQLGLSLAVLCVMILIDGYGIIFSISKTSKFSYVRVLQYIFRFGAIVLITHLTTKQVDTSIICHIFFFSTFHTYCIAYTEQYFLFFFFFT